MSAGYDRPARVVIVALQPRREISLRLPWCGAMEVVSQDEEHHQDAISGDSAGVTMDITCFAD